MKHNTRSNLNNKKSHKNNRSKMERIGIDTGLMDQNGCILKSGDMIMLKDTDYTGRLLWNNEQECFGIAMGLWYGEMNEFDCNCYGKFIEIPHDNGMRMEIIKVEGE